MQKVIKLNSRYKTNNVLIRTDDKESLIYKLKPEFECCRVGIIEDNPDEYYFIDPSGGPFITKGTIINGHKVKAIYKDYLIEFEQ